MLLQLCDHHHLHSPGSQRRVRGHSFLARSGSDWLQSPGKRDEFCWTLRTRWCWPVGPLRRPAEVGRIPARGKNEGEKQMMLTSTVTRILALPTWHTGKSHIELLSRWNVLTSSWLTFIYFSLSLIIPNDYHEKAAPFFGYASSYQPMWYATGHLHIGAHRSLYESWIVMLKSVNEAECETQTDRQREPEAFAEEMGKTWKQMDNCENEIIIHIAMQNTDMLQVAGGRKYRYLLFSYFPQGTRSFIYLFFCFWGSADRGVGR